MLEQIDSPEPNEHRDNILGLSTIIMRRLCRRLATKRKIEHIPNMTVIGNAFTYRAHKTSHYHNTETWDKKSQLRAEKECWGTYIVQYNADKDIQRNAEKVHYCASGFFRDVLGSHLHNGWPKQSYTCLEYTEPKELKATRERDSSTFHLGRCYEQLSHTSSCNQLITHRIKVKSAPKHAK